MPRSKGHPPDPPSGLRCVQIQASNTDRVPQWTPLEVAPSIRSSSSSTAEDSDAAKEDVPSDLSNTMSLTRVTEFRKASNSTSTSHHAACSAPSRPMASSSQSGPVGRHSKDQVVDPRARFLKMQASLF
jgi:hypothetical protein